MKLVSFSHVQRRVPVTILHLADRINMGNVAELESAAHQAYEEGMRYLLIDLTHAPSITSAGLRTLLIIYRLLEGAEGVQTPAAPESAPSSASRRSERIKLLNPSPEVGRTLEIAGFNRYFETHTDLEQALRSF